jgi:ribosomal protein L11 methyltransferase
MAIHAAANWLIRALRSTLSAPFPMTLTATLDLAEASARALAAAIDNDAVLGGHAFDLNELAPGRWRIAVYFPATPDAAESAALERLGAAHKAAFQIDALPETDWVAKSLEGLKPVKAGRFNVHGAHDRGRVSANEIGIEIEAGLAFGTGHHGTTSGCLIAIDDLAKARPIEDALDVGTGSGVLAIGLAKRARTRVVASDIDPVAVAVARDNVRLNGVTARVRTVVATGLGHRLIGTGAPYDLIVANILALPLVQLAPAIARHLAPGGHVILSGLLDEQKRRVAAAYRAVGLTMARTISRDGWSTLVVEKKRR